MDKETKKILDRLETERHVESEYEILDFYESGLLLDYIINLQEENEVLKKCLREPRIKSTGVILDKLPVFDIPPQDRIDKAIGYIKEDMYVEPKELYGLVDGEHLLNLLQGKSDE